MAQSYLNLDVAQNFSTFKFSFNPIESNDATYPSPDYSQISTTAFGMGYKYLHSSGAFLGAGVGFRKAGASLVYKKVNYLWNLQYVDIKAGVGYQYDKWRIKPYASLMPYYAYLLNAKQSIGLNYYDIKSDKALQNFDLGLFFNLGANVALSQYVAIYAEYSFNLGLKNIEPAPEQYLYNRGFAVKLGLSISVNTLQGNIANQPYDAVGNNLDNFTQPQNNLVQNQSTGLSNNNPQKNPLAENGITKSSNTASPPNETENIETQKIISPGTIGWARNNSSPQKKETVEEEDINQNMSDANSTVPNNPNTINSAKPPVNEKQQVAANENSTSDAGTIKSKPLVETNKKALNSDDKVVFKVQLTAVKNSLRSGHPILKNIKGDIKAEKGRDGWMRYYLGTYNTYDEALKELKKVKAKGLADGGFIVAFKNGKKITVAEAKELLK